MIKKVGLFLLFFLFLKAEYVVTITHNNYQKLKNFGIECTKYNKETYLCYKSNDKYQLKRFVSFAKKNGVNAKIEKILDKDLLNVYSIQILSTKNLNMAEKIFKKYNQFPFARIEKIGNYYTIRIGAAKNKKNLKIFANKLNLLHPFIRVSDIKIKRIVKSNFLVEKEKIKNISLKDSERNNSKKEQNNLNLDLNRLNEKVRKLVKKGNFKRACEIYTVLSIVKNDPNYKNVKNELCYFYHIKNLQKLQTDYEKIEEIEKAIKYKKTNKDLIELNYLKAKNYQPVDVNFLNSLDSNLSNDLYKKYLKTLFFAGEIKKIKEICDRKKNRLCNDIEAVFEKNNIRINDKDIKSFSLFLKKIQKNIDDDSLEKAQKKINLLYNINPDNIFADIANFELYVKKEEFNKAKKFLKKIKTLGVKNKNLLEIIKKAQKKQKLNTIKNYLQKGDLDSAQKKIITALKEYPNDFDVIILAADIFDKAKSYLSDVYYHKAYLLNKNKYFYYLLKNNKYNRLVKYKDGELRNYPYILSKVYINIAKNYLKQKKYNLALNNALKAYNLFPTSENSIIVGEIYFNLKDYNNCIKYLTGLEKSEYVTYYLGYSYYKLGDKNKAKKYLNKLLDTKDENLTAELIKVYLEMGEKEKIKDLLKF